MALDQSPCVIAEPMAVPRRGGTAIGACDAAAPEAAGDGDLVAQVLAGDTAAYGEIVTRYQRLAFAVAFRIVGSREDAEDVAQEAFVQAFRKLESFDRARPFRPWLLRIVSNGAVSFLRKQRPSVSLDELEEPGVSIPDSAPSPRERLAAAQRAELLAAAIAELPPLTRAMMEMKYREEMTMEEIGEALGKTAGAVAVAIHRARSVLRGSVGALMLQEGESSHDSR